MKNLLLAFVLLGVGAAVTSADENICVARGQDVVRH
jgi:hypothetical protein